MRNKNKPQIFTYVMFGVNSEEVSENHEKHTQKQQKPATTN